MGGGLLRCRPPGFLFRVRHKSFSQFAKPFEDILDLVDILIDGTVVLQSLGLIHARILKEISRHPDNAQGIIDLMHQFSQLRIKLPDFSLLFMLGITHDRLPPGIVESHRLVRADDGDYRFDEDVDIGEFVESVVRYRFLELLPRVLVKIS